MIAWISAYAGQTDRSVQLTIRFKIGPGVWVGFAGDGVELLDAVCRHVGQLLEHQIEFRYAFTTEQLLQPPDVVLDRGQLLL